MASERSIIRKVEHETNQRVRIHTILNDETLSKCNVQEQSVLFDKLPFEIRTLIWQLATAQCEDKKRKYANGSWYYRPGHTARAITHTDLLLTCRRIWLEANVFPMSQSEQCFYYYRSAPDGRRPTWTAKLTENNFNSLGTVHLYAQMHVIEKLSSKPGDLRSYFLRTPLKAGDFQPRVMHVTIRHTDWWNWENDEPLVFSDDWLAAMLDTADLRSTLLLKLELETLDYKVAQLMPIVDRLSRLVSNEYETHIVDGQPTTTQFVLQSSPEVYKWSGSSKINTKTYAPYRDRKTLNYHVVTLNWRLHFPQLPSAHVPAIRLSPRVVAPSTVPLRNPTSDDRARAEIGRSIPSVNYYETDHLSTVEQLWRFDMNGNLEDLAMYERMMDVQARLSGHERRHADIGEVFRRMAFNDRMAESHTTYWRGRWEVEGSLLSFVDDDE